MRLLGSTVLTLHHWAGAGDRTALVTWCFSAFVVLTTLCAPVSVSRTTTDVCQVVLVTLCLSLLPDIILWRLDPSRSSRGFVALPQPNKVVRFAATLLLLYSCMNQGMSVCVCVKLWLSMLSVSLTSMCCASEKECLLPLFSPFHPNSRKTHHPLFRSLVWPLAPGHHMLSSRSKPVQQHLDAFSGF